MSDYVFKFKLKGKDDGEIIEGISVIIDVSFNFLICYWFVVFFCGCLFFGFFEDRKFKLFYFFYNLFYKI